MQLGIVSYMVVLKHKIILPSCTFWNACRNVTDSDILSLERRLLQTMDMIISKKKR